jgi:hypothetical protein
MLDPLARLAPHRASRVVLVAAVGRETGAAATGESRTEGRRAGNTIDRVQRRISLCRLLGRDLLGAHK